MNTLNQSHESLLLSFCAVVVLGNSDALDKIDSAYFCLNLDDCVTESEVGLARNFLHSDGTNR